MIWSERRHSISSPLSIICLSISSIYPLTGLLLLIYLYFSTLPITSLQPLVALYSVTLSSLIRINIWLCWRGLGLFSTNLSSSYSLKLCLKSACSTSELSVFSSTHCCHWVLVPLFFFLLLAYTYAFTNTLQRYLSRPCISMTFEHLIFVQSIPKYRLSIEIL